jgi:hypothetical protein
MFKGMFAVVATMDEKEEAISARNALAEDAPPEGEYGSEGVTYPAGGQEGIEPDGLLWS